MKEENCFAGVLVIIVLGLSFLFWVIMDRLEEESLRDAYEEGEKAASVQIPLVHNPYIYNDERAKWQNGYINYLQTHLRVYNETK